MTGWLSRLAEAWKNHQTTSEEGVEEQVRGCPRCNGVDLDKVFFIGYSDILLDRCPNCGGFWLDGGELQKINKELSV